MAKVCFLLAAVCGLASLSVSFAEPSTTYGAAPAKYPAPAKYEAPEYKAEEKPEYKKEEKMEYKKEEYPMKMDYAGKKYRRSVDEDAEESHSDAIRLSRKEVQAVRDAVIRKLMSDSDPGIFKSFGKEGAGVLGSLIGSKIRGDPFTTVDDAGRRKFAGKLAANLAGGLLGGLLSDEKCWGVGLSRRQAKAVRDAVMTHLVVESDPAFRKSFGKAFAKEGAGAVGTFIGTKIRGGDPLSVEDLVEMYGRDPARGKFAGKLAGRLGAGVLGGLLGNEGALSMEEMDDMMDDMEPTKFRWF